MGKRTRFEVVFGRKPYYFRLIILAILFYFAMIFLSACGLSKADQEEMERLRLMEKEFYKLKEEKEQQPHLESSAISNQLLSYRIVDVAGCEYVVSESDKGYFSICHKGNCKNMH